jgi:FdrA protein
MSWHVEVIPNRYADSVRLMGIASEVRALDGVEACEIGMGTPANRETLADLGAGEVDAGPGDLMIAVSAGDEGAAREGIEAAERGLSSAGDEGGDAAGAAPPPRSVPAADDRIEGANVALVSVPGEYAALEAHQALSRGLHVFLFSDHVGVEDEIELKRRGADRGLLVMGPECGTAMLGGIGLGFANVVRRGSVGVVAGGGTGAQEVACLLDDADAGISHIVGTGGRDLSGRVGGLMFREGLRLLGADDETDALLLVAKAPAPEVVDALAALLPPDRRTVAAFVGYGGEAPFEVHPTIEAAVDALTGGGVPDAEALEREVDEARERTAGRAVLGLFSGGSLAHEAVTILEAELGPVGGNMGRGEAQAGGHTVLDLGEEEYTQGRPHPMVDLGVRIDKLTEAADDERVGCVLLDVVLGHGAHLDPSGELAPVLAPLAERGTVVARVCGTAADPQDADRQAAALREVGVLVAPSNAAAARLAARAVAT